MTCMTKELFDSLTAVHHKFCITCKHNREYQCEHKNNKHNGMFGHKDRGTSRCCLYACHGEWYELKELDQESIKNFWESLMDSFSIKEAMTKLFDKDCEE